MRPLNILDEEVMGDGKRLVLRQRGDHFFITIDGQELMSSRATSSEQTLAQRASAALRDVGTPRVLIGGLGMGYTVSAALHAFPDDATIVLAEVFSRVVDWNHTYLGHLADHPLRDRRVEVRRVDVASLLSGSRYDAILLDVDNGPRALTLPSNDALYTVAGVNRLYRALRPGGVLAVWSAAPETAFLKRMRRVGFSVRYEKVPADCATGAQHVIFLGER